MTLSPVPETAIAEGLCNLRTYNKARLFERISHAARKLFQAQGYSSVTMEQLAADAGVSKRTLYKYFPAKEAVLAHLLEMDLARDLADCGQRFETGISFRESVSKLLAESAAWCGQHPDYLLPYIRYKFATFEPAVAAVEERGLVGTWTLLISHGQQRGELNASRPATQLAIYFHYLYLGALMRWLTDGKLSLHDEFMTVVGLFVDGAASA